MTRAEADQIGVFLEAAGWGGAERRMLAGDASARRYERLCQQGTTAVLMVAPRSDDLGRFTRMANWLRAHGFSAPEVLAEAAPSGLLLLEDLGDALVSRLVAEDAGREGPLYALIGDVLAALRPLAPPEFLVPLEGAGLGDLVRLTADWYPTLSQDAARALPDLIETLYRQLDDGARVVCLRDFHAENALWLPGRRGVARLGLLDFQDAVICHPAYDLVSALQDARRSVSPAVESAEVRRYVLRTGADQSRFEALYALLGVQRALRILGVFARLSLAMGKPQYADLMPRSWAHITRNLAHPALADLAVLVQAAFTAPGPEVIERIKAECGQHPMR